MAMPSFTSIPDDPVFPNGGRSYDEGSTVYINGSAVKLGKKLGSGGEGDVFEYNSSAIKIYHPKKITKRQQAKLTLLVSLNISDKRIVAPKSLVKDQNNNIIGFVMNKIINAENLFRVIVIDFKPWNRIQLIDCAISILTAFYNLHNIANHKVLLGDINLNNICISDSGDIYILDIDSAQIDGFPCPVGTPEFTRSTLAGESFSNLIRSEEDEYFSIAVLLFLMFMGNVHPFRHKNGGSVEQDIKAGIFPYNQNGTVTNEVPEGYAKIRWPYLNDEIRRAFCLSFNGNTRLFSPKEWIDLLMIYKDDILKQVKFGYSEYNLIAVTDYPRDFIYKPRGTTQSINPQQQPKAKTTYTICEICGSPTSQGPFCAKHERSVRIKKDNTINEYNVGYVNEVSRWMKTNYPVGIAKIWFIDFLKKLEKRKFKDYLMSNEVLMFIKQYRDEYNAIVRYENTIIDIVRNLNLLDQLTLSIKNTAINQKDYTEALGISNIVATTLRNAASSSLSNTEYWKCIIQRFQTINNILNTVHSVKCIHCGRIEYLSSSQYANIPLSGYICTDCNSIVTYHCPKCGVNAYQVHKYELSAYRKEKRLCSTCQKEKTNLEKEINASIASLYDSNINFLNINFDDRKSRFEAFIKSCNSVAEDFYKHGNPITINYDIPVTNNLLCIEKSIFPNIQKELRKAISLLSNPTPTNFNKERQLLVALKERLSIETYKQDGFYIPFNKFPVFNCCINKIDNTIKIIENRINEDEQKIAKIRSDINSKIEVLKRKNIAFNYSFKQQSIKNIADNALKELAPYSYYLSAIDIGVRLEELADISYFEESVYSDIIDMINHVSSSGEVKVESLQIEITQLENLNAKITRDEKILSFSRDGKKLNGSFSYKDFLCFPVVSNMLDTALIYKKKILSYADGNILQQTKSQLLRLSDQQWSSTISELKDDFISDDVPEVLKKDIISILDQALLVESFSLKARAYSESLKDDFKQNYQKSFLLDSYNEIKNAVDNIFKDRLLTIFKESRAKELEAIKCFIQFSKKREQSFIRKMVVSGFTALCQIIVMFVICIPNNNLVGIVCGFVGIAMTLLFFTNYEYSNVFGVIGFFFSYMSIAYNLDKYFEAGISFHVLLDFVRSSFQIIPELKFICTTTMVVISAVSYVMRGRDEFLLQQYTRKLKKELKEGNNWDSDSEEA